MNRVVLIGNLTKDPEITTTSSGVSVCRFVIAVTRRFANQDGEREADFMNIVAWRALAENCHKFIKKGSKVAVIGSIQNRTYDATDGTKRYITEIIADEVEFLTTKNSDNAGDNKKDEEVSKLQPIDDDGLPF